MPQDIFIGVDGGGTKTKVRIEDEAGNLLGQGLGGPSNIRLSIDGSWQSILHVIEEILKPMQIVLSDTAYRFHAGMGLAGCEVKEAYEEFLRRPHPFLNLRVTSDAHIACVGAHKGKDGSVILVGTGVVGYQICEGSIAKVGGWGFPHDDIGGGAWLGMEAVHLTFQWLDHRGEKSPLAEDVFAFFNKDLDHFVTWANGANASEFARLAPLVVNHSQQEEIAAVRLIKKAAHAIERIGATLVKMQAHREPPLPCCFFWWISTFY